MGYKYIGDAKLGASLTVTTPKPLDSRSVIHSIDAMEALKDLPENTAYEGMTVANSADGNIYMLIDKNKIKEKAGWKASYESLLIITCTLDEYDEWAKNTSEEFTPIIAEKPFLYPNTYYYTYDQKDTSQLYLSAEWGLRIEDLLSKKAGTDYVTNINNDLETYKTFVSTHYLDSDALKLEYVPLSSIDLDSPDSFLSITLGKYYTISAADEKFVTRAELLEGTEGGLGFKFVAKEEYIKDKEAFLIELDKTLKVDGQGQLSSITTAQIKSPLEGDDQLVVDVKPTGLFIGEDSIAKKSEIPVIVTITETDYKALEEAGTVKPDVYYYIYDIKNEDLFYITFDYLKHSYHNVSLYQTWCSSTFYSLTDERVVLKTDLEPYALTATIASKYLLSDIATKTYATKNNLEELQTKVETEYVTKASLKGNTSTSDEDFVFLTKNKYDQDRTADTIKFKSTSLETSTLTFNGTENNNTVLKADNSKLIVNDKEVALLESVPQIVCISENDYKLLETKDNNVYYYTYNSEDEKTDGYVPISLLRSSYYKKSDVDAKISTLEEKVTALTILMQEIWNFFSNSAISQITNETSISNITIIAKNEHN